MSRYKSDQLCDEDKDAWILERASSFKRPSSSTAVDRLIQGVKDGLGLGTSRRVGSAGKKIDQEVVVSAPGKVILFGEHAVVHGVVCPLFECAKFHADLRRPQ
jgi:hypothetical protein